MCLSENNIKYSVKYSTIAYKYSTLINDTVSNVISKINSARAGDENFNNMFYWSILYKKVYLSLEEKYISSALMHIVYIID